MQSADLQRSLPALFDELVHGAAGHGGVMLNGGDRGLLASLDRLTAEQASTVSGASSIAANCETWLARLTSDRPVEGIELNGVIGSIAHLAYHLGAIRQMHPLAKGPSAND